MSVPESLLVPKPYSPAQIVTAISTLLLRASSRPGSISLLNIILRRYWANYSYDDFKVREQPVGLMFAFDPKRTFGRKPQAASLISSRLQISTRAAVSSSIISALCCGPGVKRRRSVPRGTVGKLIG
jgi:hypothetical protein